MMQECGGGLTPHEHLFKVYMPSRRFAEGKVPPNDADILIEINCFDFSATLRTSVIFNGNDKIEFTLALPPSGSAAYADFRRSANGW
jgi:hypothetical protein